ncbi:serine/threonine-protein kinase PknK, partial [candidate division TA06 bacterium]|nr:serine/threonine-protein kinase PknK [candidate division TA06 bacterium]
MKIVERYEVIKSLGRGGWGEVFLVKDSHQRDDRLRRMALKLTRPELSPGELLQLKQEFYLLSHLDHPNILKVFDFGETQEKEYYFTMEFIEGRRFNQYFAPRFAKGMGEVFYDAVFQLLSALHFIHQKGWVHSDLKPSNLLITKENHVKLLDFGFAESFQNSDSDGFKGTLGYIAPEILKGNRGDPRSDLYSLGVLLYETLTHRPPFDGDTPLQIIRSQLEEIPPSPNQINSHIPPLLSEIVMRLLEGDPSNRYLSAEEVFEAIRTHCKLQNEHFKMQIDHFKMKNDQWVFTPPLISREEELAQFQKLLLRAKKGAGGVVLLSGERGVGKSRLLQE